MTGHPSHDGPPDVRDLPPYAQLYSPEFHADPEAAWQRLREGGRVAWVALQPGVLTLLVLDHNLIVSFSRDTTRWTRKTTRWNGWGLVDNSEIAAMISEWRNMLFAEGPEQIGCAPLWKRPSKRPTWTSCGSTSSRPPWT
ncbi:hypothetical protein GCM10022416_61690 [Actinomadura keratinilytica]|uniref:Uncharacterized protein n=1 Tax=Actinomadura keratinilytica TaxID=547461 RepID=A0ABP6UJX1_9ACTN